MRILKHITVNDRVGECPKTSVFVLAVFCWLIFLSLPLCSNAESLRELSLGEMVGLADEILVGKVESSEARWQGKLIVTVTTVQVQESIKGIPGSQVEITQLGGTAVHPVIGSPVHMSASSYVALLPGEEVLLFVRKAPKGVRDLVGGQQGKFMVQADPDTGAKVLPIGPKKVKVFEKEGRKTVVPRQISLDELRQRIRQEMTAGPGRKKP